MKTKVFFYLVVACINVCDPDVTDNDGNMPKAEYVLCKRPVLYLVSLAVKFIVRRLIATLDEL